MQLPQVFLRTKVLNEKYERRRIVLTAMGTSVLGVPFHTNKKKHVDYSFQYAEMFAPMSRIF